MLQQRITVGTQIRYFASYTPHNKDEGDVKEPMGPNETSTWTDDIDFESDGVNEHRQGIKKSESERSNIGNRLRKDHFFVKTGLATKNR